MQSVEHILEEIDQVQSLIAARQAISTPDQTTILVDNLAKNIARKITELRTIDTKLATKLTVAISNSAFSMVGKSQLTAAVDLRLQSATPPPRGNATQKLENVRAYLTKSEWDQLLDNSEGAQVVPLQSVIDMLINRFGVLLGITNPAEQNTKNVVALILATRFKVFPSYPDVKKLVDAVKEQFEAVKSTPPFGHICDFPSNPKDLATPILQAAYPTELPEYRNVDKMDAILKSHIPMRKSSKLLREAKPSGEASSAAVDPNNPAAQMLAGLMMTLLEARCQDGQLNLNMLGGMPSSSSLGSLPALKNSPDHSPRTTAGENLHNLGSKANESVDKAPKAIVDGKGDDDEDDSDEGGDRDGSLGVEKGRDRVSMSDYEAATIAKLKCQASKGAMKSVMKKKSPETSAAKVMKVAMKAASGKGAKKSKPSMSVEWSRDQVLCRTGVLGEPSLKFPLKEHGGQAKAIAKGKQWLADQFKKAKRG